MNNNQWLSLRYQVSKEIMNTDILCEIMHHPEDLEKAEKCLNHVFTLLCKFEARFSRFKKDNELWHFNHSTHHHPSKDLFNLLSGSRYYHHLTNGLFDPSILPALEKEGYKSNTYSSPSVPHVFTELIITHEPEEITKPLGLLIDFGGIGKGYIVDQVATYLSEHFENFLIDAGGDIYTSGTNQKEGYPYWVVEVENPEAEEDPAALLLLKDMAVATSGRSRRHWIQDDKHKHHIIDPRTDKSASPDFLSVTVIAGSVISADILAKVLFISGKTKAYALAEKFHIAALFIEDTGKIVINSYAQNYVWHAT